MHPAISVRAPSASSFSFPVEGLGSDVLFSVRPTRRSSSIPDEEVPGLPGRKEVRMFPIWEEADEVLEDLTRPGGPR